MDHLDDVVDSLARSRDNMQLYRGLSVPPYYYYRNRVILLRGSETTAEVERPGCIFSVSLSVFLARYAFRVCLRHYFSCAHLSVDSTPGRDEPSGTDRPDRRIALRGYSGATAIPLSNDFAKRCVTQKMPRGGAKNLDLLLLHRPAGASQTEHVFHYASERVSHIITV